VRTACALVALALAAGEAPQRGPRVDPDVLDATARSGRYYRHIDLRGWSADGTLVYEAQSSGSDAECGSPLSWKLRLLVFRAPAGAEPFRLAAEGYQDFATSPIEGSLQAARTRAGCSAEDAVVREYDAAGPAEEGAVRLTKLGALTPVCRLDRAHRSCASPDGASALEIDFSPGRPDARGCHRDHLRYVLRTAKRARKQLLAFSGSSCAVRNDVTFQVSWSPESRKVAAATNAELQGQSAMVREVFARLDVFDVGASGP
jgi:hypothetical protein